MGYSELKKHPGCLQLLSRFYTLVRACMHGLLTGARRAFAVKPGLEAYNSLVTVCGLTPLAYTTASKKESLHQIC